jgi:hypothetical protein
LANTAVLNHLVFPLNVTFLRLRHAAGWVMPTRCFIGFELFWGLGLLRGLDAFQPNFSLNTTLRLKTDHDGGMGCLNFNT